MLKLFSSPQGTVWHRKDPAFDQGCVNTLPILFKSWSRKVRRKLRKIQHSHGLYYYFFLQQMKRKRRNVFSVETDVPFNWKWKAFLLGQFWECLWKGKSMFSGRAQCVSSVFGTHSGSLVSSAMSALTHWYQMISHSSLDNSETLVYRHIHWAQPLPAPHHAADLRGSVRFHMNGIFILLHPSSAAQGRSARKNLHGCG